MKNQELANRLREFRAKLREEANKMIADLELDRRILARKWMGPRRKPRLWSEVAHRY